MEELHRRPNQWYCVAPEGRYNTQGTFLGFLKIISSRVLTSHQKAKKPSPADKVVQVVSKGQHAQTSKKDKKVKPEKKEKMEQKEDSEDDYSYSDPEFSDEREHEGTTEQDVAAVFAALKAKKVICVLPLRLTLAGSSSKEQYQHQHEHKIATTKPEQNQRQDREARS